MALTFRIAIKLWFCSIHCLALLCFRGIILVGFSGEILGVFVGLHAADGQHRG